jgi:hypothetical protein
MATHKTGCPLKAPDVHADCILSRHDTWTRRVVRQGCNGAHAKRFLQGAFEQNPAQALVRDGCKLYPVRPRKRPTRPRAAANLATACRP